MKLIIDIDDEMYKRICEAQSVPDMYGTDIVNAINRVKKGTPVSTNQALEEKPHSAEKVKIKSTKDLINNIVGFDLSGIKPLPEYLDGITDAEQKEVKNNVD